MSAIPMVDDYRMDTIVEQNPTHVVPNTFGQPPFRRGWMGPNCPYRFSGLGNETPYQNTMMMDVHGRQEPSAAAPGQQKGKPIPPGHQKEIPLADVMSDMERRLEQRLMERGYIAYEEIEAAMLPSGEIEPGVTVVERTDEAVAAPKKFMETTTGKATAAGAVLALLALL